jgi:DNA-binding NtrC family response regulator
VVISDRELDGAFGIEPSSVIPFRLEKPRRQKTARLNELEREHIVEVLQQVNGNRMQAAKLLGISRRALYRRLERHRIVDKPAVHRLGHES